MITAFAVVLLVDRARGKYRRQPDVADPPWWQRATAWGKRVGARVERRLQQVGEAS